MILQNQIHCNLCGDEPYSANRHDFRYCKGGHTAVDGGLDYLRRVGGVDYTDISIEMDTALVADLVTAIDKASESGRNPLGIICAIARTLRDEGYEIVAKPVQD